MQRGPASVAACALLLLALAAAGCGGQLQEAAAAGDGGGSPPGIVQPDYSLYLKKDELLKKVEAVVASNPSTMRVETKHAADGNYSADLMVVTYEPGGLSASHVNKARLLMDFGEHGREFITSEVGLRLLQTLTDTAALRAMLGSAKRLERLQAILQHTVMQVLPLENVHGRDLVESGQLCERKNGRGVDPNRNWDIDWGKKEKDYDPKEEFPGRAPLSEPEVQVLLGLARALKPHVWLNVHSGMFALFTPYDHKASTPNTTAGRAALRMMGRIKQLSCPKCVVGSGGHSVGYLAHGTGTDYMFEVLGVPMSFTWEIYGDPSASFHDCFRMFNPLGRQKFESVVTLWVRALLQLLELLPSHPATWPLFKAAGLQQAPDAVLLAGDGGGSSSSSSSSSDERQQQGEPADGAGGAQTDSGDEQQQLQQQQQQGGDGQSSEQDITIVAVPGPDGDGGSTADGGGLGLFRSQRLLPLVLGLGGLIALAYCLQRSISPAGLGYSKVLTRARTR